MAALSRRFIKWCPFILSKRRNHDAAKPRGRKPRERQPGSASNSNTPARTVALCQPRLSLFSMKYLFLASA
jgi:hypothetical protein